MKYRVKSASFATFYAIRLYALIAKKYTTIVMPTHHASALNISFPTGSELIRERKASTMNVTG